jgi:hypothetical protein
VFRWVGRGRAPYKPGKPAFTADAAKVSDAIDKIGFRDRQVRSSNYPLLTEYDAYRIANGLDPMAFAIKAEARSQSRPIKTEKTGRARE